MIRKPVVDGQFYPELKEDLLAQISGFAVKQPSRTCAKGVILPHAGYVYSGKVATITVGKIVPKKTLVILGPNHTGLGPSFGLWSRGAWETPFGQIDIDCNLAKTILAKGAYIVEDFSAHKNEHSIEVELPIFCYFFSEFNFVPLICKANSLQVYREVSAQLFEAIRGTENKDEILLVASTDLTHYEPDQAARRKDRMVIESIINLDEEELLRRVGEENITMCGVAPVAILIATLKKLGARKSEVALYQTSGDSSGDRSSVVGYAGMIIS